MLMQTVQSNPALVSDVQQKNQLDRVTTILKWTYGLVPIVAGADKFFHILVNWDQYLAPAVTDIISLQPHTFILITGVVEIIAGILVLTRPKIGSLIVAVWLVGIVLNLLLLGNYYDVAVRDAVMAIGAGSLYLLLKEKEESELYIKGEEPKKTKTVAIAH